jgi:hypothetical protein
MKMTATGRFAKGLIGGWLLIVPALLPAAAKADVKAAQTPGEGWVFVDEGLASAMQGETEHHFARAREFYLSHDATAAAAEVRKGAVVLRLESSRAVGRARSALREAEQRLETVAKGIESGSPLPLEALASSFARAERALAVHQQLKARQYWEHRDLQRLAQALRAAANHLEQHLVHLGQRGDQDAAASLRRVRNLADHLDESEEVSGEEVRAVLDTLNSELRRRR